MGIWGAFINLEELVTKIWAGRYGSWALFILHSEISGYMLVPIKLFQFYFVSLILMWAH